jgi:hypothetical protein
MLGKKAFITASNKENDLGPLNMLRKQQKSRKEQLERKLSSRNIGDINIKENINVNGEKDQPSKVLQVAKPRNDFLNPPQLQPTSILVASASATKDEYRNRETQRLMKTYAMDLIRELLEKEQKYWVKEFLAAHTIPANIRAKMIDWMVEVLCSYKCSNHTFFVAVYYLDAFFKYTEKKYDINDLHLAGVASMFLAAKFEEIYPLRIKVVHEKIAHKKFSKEEIRDKETEMISALDFNCCPVTLLSFIECSLSHINMKEVLPAKLNSHLEKLCVYIAKMVMHDYEIINKFSPSYLSGACIYISLKIVQQLDNTFKIEGPASKLKVFLDIKENEFFECSQQVLDLAKNFESRYQTLTNLSKFHSFSLDDNAKDTKDSTSEGEGKTEKKSK